MIARPSRALRAALLVLAVAACSAPRGGAVARDSATPAAMDHSAHAGHAAHAGDPAHAAHMASGDSAFTALQKRGADSRAMGVDQYTSTHRFDSLEDGGRIELQRDPDASRGAGSDAAAVAQIRAHLRSIADAFRRGDFTTPAFVHGGDSVPGTRVMAERRARIEYRYADLPRGGEVRIVTTDPEARRAVHEFLAFQRSDHRAGGRAR